MPRLDANAHWRLSRGGRSGMRVALSIMVAIGIIAFTGLSCRGEGERVPPAATKPTALGINLFGLANYNRQQVYLNMILQSEWFSSQGQGWTPMPTEQLDAQGWIRQLRPGQTAPRPLMLPPAPFRDTAVRCQFRGQGEFSAGGIARVTAQEEGVLSLMLTPSGSAEDGAWIELLRTDPTNPVRDIDCRETSQSRDERFHPAFLEFVESFKIVRFLDWQKINDNRRVSWAQRPTPASASQVGVDGASIEDMVELANRTGTDPWFLMPYQADAQYIRQFAQVVHDRIDPDRTVYIELGNEVWNDMFDAAQQARREGVDLNLGGGDPKRAQMVRYAQKLRATMQIWTDVFSDRPRRLVRVAASQHAWPDLAQYVLEDSDTGNWVDALATAPYIWFDLNGKSASDVDGIFAVMPRAIEDTFRFADQNRAIALRHGKRFIAYEGGQHLVTADLTLARMLQRDPRMGDVYTRYLTEWDTRIGDALVLYASSAPIANYGSWGLMEYVGQPIAETPKLRAVRNFRARAR